MAAQGLYKIKTIASLTGFSPTLLRAWERRYELLEPARAPSGHRLYTEDDLVVLQRVRLQLARGRSIGEIVVLGRGALLNPDGPTALLPALPEPAGELEELREAAILAALNLDQSALARILDRAFASVSPEQVINHLIVPACRQIGSMWAEEEASVASEHLMTQVFTRRLQAILEAEARDLSGSRRGICACLPDEQHELGALLVTRELLRAGIQATYLGPCLPLADLEHAVQLRRPDFVCLSVTRPGLLDSHRAALLEMLARQSKDVLFVLGGAAVLPNEQYQLAEAGMRLWGQERPLAELKSLYPSENANENG